MIAAIANGQNCWILPYAPNTSSPVRLGITLPVDTQRALIGASSRRPQAVALRSALEWTARIKASEFAQLRNATQTAQDQPILAPAWPFARPAAVPLPIGSGLVVAWTVGWNIWAINPGSLAAYDFHAPLLFGRLDAPPSLAGRNGLHVDTDFHFYDDGQAGFALTPPAAADTMFATPIGYSAPVFPWAHAPDQPPKPGTAIVTADRTATGPGRIKSSAFYPQQPERTQETTLKLRTSDDAVALLGWWQRRAGTADSHWIATTQQIGRLTAVAPAGTNALYLDGTQALGANNIIALYEPGVQELVTVTNPSATPLPLVAPLAHTWSPSTAVVTLAMLARHTNEELVLNFLHGDSDWIADCTLAWREVAPELNPPAGETRGATLGRLPGAAWFFQVDLDYNGAIVSTYLTNWEAGAFANLIAWAYNACDFDHLVASRDLEDDSCTYTMRWYAGCPWENWMPGQLAARGIFTVFRADVDGAGNFSNFHQEWKGELSTPKRDGPDLKVKVLGANALFALNAPRQLMTPVCGTNLFKTRCGQLLADWTFNAIIQGVASNVVTIGAITRANGSGLPAGFGAADWFALGWMGWTSAGLPLRDGVLTSTALAGGQIALTLERAVTLAVGTAVIAVPGCDRLGPTCRTKFNNYPNFRGFEFMPAISPSFIIPQRNTTAAKK